MAVLDLESLRGAVAPEIFDAAFVVAEELDDLHPRNGGVLGTVGQDGPAPHRAWAGFVDDTLAGRCECGTAATDPDDLCVHVVAVVIAALNEAFPWSASAEPPDTLDEPEPAPPAPGTAAALAQGAPRDESPEEVVRRLAGVAATVPPVRLANLVAAHAAVDPRLESALLAAAGLPGVTTRPAAKPESGHNGQKRPNGRGGHEGRNGPNGQEGLNSRTGHEGPNGRNGHEGPNGRNGHEGPNGRNGHEGANGRNGREGLIWPQDSERLRKA